MGLMTVIPLAGGAGSDILNGNRGADTFDVGYGNATINGSSGSDKLIYSTLKN
jgi:Ca2+-binding RTX toxin-like protein